MKKKAKDALVADLKKLKDRWQPEADQIEKFKSTAEDLKKKIKIDDRVSSNISSEVCQVLKDIERICVQNNNIFY